MQIYNDLARKLFQALFGCFRPTCTLVYHVIARIFAYLQFEGTPNRFYCMPTNYEQLRTIKAAKKRSLTQLFIKQLADNCKNKEKKTSRKILFLRVERCSICHEFQRKILAKAQQAQATYLLAKHGYTYTNYAVMH